MIAGTIVETTVKTMALMIHPIQEMTQLPRQLPALVEQPKPQAATTATMTAATTHLQALRTMLLPVARDHLLVLHQIWQKHQRRRQLLPLLLQLKPPRLQQQMNLVMTCPLRPQP